MARKSRRKKGIGLVLSKATEEVPVDSSTALSTSGILTGRETRTVYKVENRGQYLDELSSAIAEIGHEAALSGITTTEQFWAKISKEDQRLQCYEINRGGRKTRRTDEVLFLLWWCVRQAERGHKKSRPFSVREACKRIAKKTEFSSLDVSWQNLALYYYDIDLDNPFISASAALLENGCIDEVNALAEKIAARLRLMNS